MAACPPAASAPDASPEAWSEAAPTFAEVGERYTSLYAEQALLTLAPGAGERFLDVAAGPGWMSVEAARRGAEVLGVDFAPGMTAHLRARARRENLHALRAETMDGQALDLPDESFDAAASAFGLIFFPDTDRGLRELRRVLAIGGRAAVLAWSEPEAQRFFQAVRRSLERGVPELAIPDEPPRWAQLSSAEGLAAAMERAGFRRVRVETLQRRWEAPSAAWLWERLPRLSPATAGLFQQLDEAQTAAFGEAFVQEMGDAPAMEGEAHLGLGIR